MTGEKPRENLSRDDEDADKERTAHELEDTSSRTSPESNGEEGPYVHHKMSRQLALSLTAMSFLWVGSQIPLYLFGSVLTRIYGDIGGVDRYSWFTIAYLIPNACLCPFVGALSDLFGRRYVAMIGQVSLIIGAIITSTAKTMNTAIAGQVFSGIGAGLNEMIALAATGEMVPVKKRGFYVGLVVFTILPFCPSVVYAQLIWKASSWRHNGILIGVWNLIGLVLVAFCYKDPPRVTDHHARRDIVRQVDYIGGLTSTVGVLLFMMGMEWGASQYEWSSVQVLVPLFLGVFFIALFFLWEIKFAPYPMCPPKLFSKAKRTVIIMLFITFLSGGNFFALLLFWPTQIYNVYGDDPVQIGLRSLPIGFGIIGGAFIALILIPLTKGRITAIMIVATAIMTAATGAMSVSNPHNLPAMYGIVTVAALGVGAVIIPSAIIAQIACPDEFIATITAITLAIRYIGGAIGYTAYYNIFYHNFVPAAQKYVLFDAIIDQKIVKPTQESFYLMLSLVTYVGNAEYDKAKEVIATNPNVRRKDVAFEIIVNASQKAFAAAYRYPYWMSIAFGGLCFILSFFLKDIRQFLTDDIAGAKPSPAPAEREDKPVTV